MVGMNFRQNAASFGDDQVIGGLHSRKTSLILADCFSTTPRPLLSAASSQMPNTPGTASSTWMTFGCHRLQHDNILTVTREATAAMETRNYHGMHALAARIKRCQESEGEDC
jgi:hypothetical protein